MTDSKQYRFRDGEVVLDDDEPPLEPDPIEPGAKTGFRVEIKPGALDANPALRTVGDEYGRILEFGTRSNAEVYTAQLSTAGGPLRVQAAAPNDPADVDAYLLAEHDPSIDEPASVEGETLTFDVGANLYGTLGEAILTGTPKPHALEWFVRRDLGTDGDEGRARVTIDIETDCVVALDDDSSADRLVWSPDCKLLARDGRSGELLERYYCEIKTGNASFERDQLATMNALARDERVLKIRVLIDELPDRYSLRILEVEPPGET